MKRTENLNIGQITPIIAPEDMKQVFPVTDRMADFVTRSRGAIRDILYGRDSRIMAVVGPCSIHDPEAALDYARKLKTLADEIRDQIFVVMRVYFEKPRTTVGWKGLINDPDLDGTHEISKGLGVARSLLCEVTKLGLPTATETLDPISPQYLAALISWGAIGARTTESQIHREMASGLSFPVGIKNGTDGNMQIAFDAILAGNHPHSFLGISSNGRAAIVRTVGNPDLHLVLRGGNEGPNYSPENVAKAEELLKKAGVETPGIIIDCSHMNSYKDHTRQHEPLQSAVEQICRGDTSICGVMIESNLKAGNQPFPGDPKDLQYGVSITDKCVDWDTTEKMLKDARDKLKACNGRKSGK